MKPSLEALGRFDDERVRGRFLETFVPSETKKLTENGQLVGFFVIRHKPDHVHLDHLYIDPDMQSRGFGAPGGYRRWTSDPRGLSVLDPSLELIVV